MGLSINASKMKTIRMLRSKDNINVNIMCNNSHVDQKDYYVYLGHLINNHIDYNTERKWRTEILKISFMKCRRMLCNKELNILYMLTTG